MRASDNLRFIHTEIVKENQTGMWRKLLTLVQCHLKSWGAAQWQSELHTALASTQQYKKKSVLIKIPMHLSLPHQHCSEFFFPGPLSTQIGLRVWRPFPPYILGWYFQPEHALVFWDKIYFLVYYYLTSGGHYQSIKCESHFPWINQFEEFLVL